MNINDLPGGSPERIPGGSPKINPPNNSKFESRTSTNGVENGKTVDSQHTRDPEVVGLVRKLTDTPEIRLERIAEVQQKIQSGDFLSRQNAEATAEAFLR